MPEDETRKLYEDGTELSQGVDDKSAESAANSSGECSILSGILRWEVLEILKADWKMHILLQELCVSTMIPSV